MAEGRAVSIIWTLIVWRFIVSDQRRYSFEWTLIFIDWNRDRGGLSYECSHSVRVLFHKDSRKANDGRVLIAGMG